MLHDGAEGERRGKGYGERIGDGGVVLGKGVFLDVEAEATVKVEEEDASEVVALADDDGVQYMVSVGDSISTREELQELILFDLGMEGV